MTQQDFSAETKLHSKRMARELAMQFLFECDMLQVVPEFTRWETFFEQIRDEHGLRDKRFARKSREYAEELFTGVAVHLDEIDDTIRAQSENWDFARLATVDRNVMRVAVFEMLYKEDVPPVVSINEAVEIAMDYSGEKAGSFINGVLNGVKNNLSRSPRESGAAE